MSCPGTQEKEVSEAVEGYERQIQADAD